MELGSILFSVLGIGTTAIAAIGFLALSFRRVVKTNEVHIVQTSKETKSFGKDTENGNVYYAFPSWIPLVGVSTIVLPTSVFEINIKEYEAYDLERLPFKVDLTAFFHISDSNEAAQRIASIKDLENQLEMIIQGAVRSILSSKKLTDILQMRSELGGDFTGAVGEQLKQWGVKPVKNIELMDIRDSADSHVIQDIMAIKKSDIERESRTQVAQNKKLAQIAEIEADKETKLKEQESEKQVGLKTVETKREVHISEQQAQQQLEQELKRTTEQKMEVLQVEQIRKAEINKEVALVEAQKEQTQRQIQADTDKSVSIINAEADKQKQILLAEGQKQQAVLQAEANLESKQKEAQGIKSIGEAEAKSRELLEISLIAGQINLAQEIGNNESYQKYLISVRQIEANEKIGIEQAQALANAELKIIVNEGSVNSGIDKISQILSTNGGVQLGSFIEGLSNTSETGKLLIDNFAKKLGTNTNSANQ